MIKQIYRKFDVLSLVISLVAGAAVGVINNKLYAAMYGKVWTPILVGLWFLVLSAVLFLVIRVCGVIRNDNLNRKGLLIPTLMIFGCVFLAGLFLEIVYEIGPKGVVAEEPTSYIFLFDDSSSMEINDSNNSRNSAVYSVIQQCDANFPVCVYKFTTGCTQVTGMQPAGTVGLQDYGFCNEGGTAVLSAIRCVADDITGDYIDGGASPRILLFSDGISSSFGMNFTLRYAQENNISISTIGLGDASEKYLQKIADRTGGVYISIDSIAQLGSALHDAGERQSEYSRNLINYRPYTSLDLLYAIMRIVFLLVLGLSAVLLKAAFFCTKEIKNKAVFLGIILAITSTVLIEIGINSIGFSDESMRFLFCVCYMTLIGTQEVVKFLRTEHDDEIEDNGSDIIDSDTDGYNFIRTNKHDRIQALSLVAKNKESNEYDEFDV